MVTTSKKAERKSQVLNRTRAREMRSKPVSTEDLFWFEVRGRKLGGFKFKRQFLIGPYIADFVCVEKKLIVELDGPLHNARYDVVRGIRSCDLRTTVTKPISQVFFRQFCKR